MAQPRASGPQDLTALWHQAVNEFSDNASKGLSKHKIKVTDPNSSKKSMTVKDWEDVFFENAPDQWKQTFETARKSGGDAARFRTATNTMLVAVQEFAAPFTMVVEGAASAYAPLAPAVILTKGLFWVMKTFSSVSMRFDMFISFCDKIKEVFENISIFKKDDLVRKLGPVVSRRILELFKSVLRVYTLCIEEPKKRAATWWHVIIKGDEDIQAALSAVEGAKNNLNDSLTLDMVATTRRIEEKADQAAAYQRRLHETDSARDTRRHTEIISRLDRMESMRVTTPAPAPKSKDPAARKDADIMWLREQLSRTDQSQFVQDLRSQLVPDASHWLLSTDKIKNWTAMTGPRTLWISGAPGSGKTYLALSIVDELHQKPDKTLAYFFFREDQNEFRDLDRALACMVVKRAEYDVDYRKLVISRLKKLNQEGRKDLTSEEIWKEFVIGCQPESDKKQQSGLFIILDGIDEASKGEQSKLLGLLSGNDAWIRLLITARNPPTTDVESLELSIMDISAIPKEEAMNGWRALCRSRIEALPRLKRFRNQTKKKITKTISQNADGMLYVETMLIQLETIGLELPVSRALQKQLPSNMDELHVLILENCFKGRDKSEREILTDLFAWLAFAKRDLSLREAKALVTMLADGKPVFNLEREIMQRLSGILDIFRTFDNAEDFEEDFFGQEDYESDSDDGSELDHSSLPLRFSKRWLRDFFKKENGGDNNLKKTPYESHLVIFSMCGDILCTNDVGSLTAYAAKYWVDHFLELAPNLQVISDDICLPVIKCLKKILNSEGRIAFKLEEYGSATYDQLKNLEGEQRWVDLVQRWAKRGAAMSFDKDSEGAAASDWAKSIIANRKIEEIMIPLAKSHFGNIFDQTGPWWSNELFRLACGSLSMTNIATVEVKKSFDQMTAQDVQTIIRHYVEKFQPTEDARAIDRAIAFIQEDFGQLEALESYQYALERCESRKDQIYCLMGLARIHDQRGNNTEASKRCEEALETIAGGVSQDDAGAENVRALKREAYLMLARYAIQASQSESDENEVRGLGCRIIQLLTQAQEAIPGNQLAGKDIDVLTSHVVKSHGAQELMKQMKTWPSEAGKTWLTWVFQNENRDSLSRFREAALAVQEEQKMLDRIIQITRSMFHTSHGSWALYELAWTFRYTLRQTDEAKRILRRLLQMKTHLTARKLLYDARLDLADIIYTDFRGTVRRNQRESLLKDMNELPPLDNQDLANSLISVPLARMTRIAGEMKRFEDILNSTFNVCITALEDGEEKNDQDSFRLLAKVLSCLPGLEKQVKIAYSLQFSVLVPKVEPRPNAELYRSYSSTESRDQQGYNTLEVMAMAHQESISEHMRALQSHETTNGSSTKRWKLPPCPWNHLCCLQFCWAERKSESPRESAETSAETKNLVLDTENPTSASEDEKDVETEDDLMDNDKNFQPNFDSEDLVSHDEQIIRCNGCNDCDVSLRWWREPLYLCLTCCTNIDLCSRCLKKLKDSKDGKVDGNLNYYCGKDHKYIRGPIEGWRGVRDRYICITGEDPLDFDDWLARLKKDWQGAWRAFWEAEASGRDIF